MSRLFKFLSSVILGLSFLLSSATFSPTHAQSAECGLQSSTTSMIGGISAALIPIYVGPDEEPQDCFIRAMLAPHMSLDQYNGGVLTRNENGVAYSPGLLGHQTKLVALMYDNQPSSREYIADLVDSIGIPSVSTAYAQGTGYTALSSFLPFWKVFRNLAYSLYIIMFVVVGVMIMLRTKVNAQTVITIQNALPNLLITLILITFSYAIVGLMIDLMYFLIYFLVYLVSAAGIIQTPTKAIARLLNYSAYSVIFEGRNSIVSAAALALGEIFSGLGTGALEIAGTLISLATPAYLLVAFWLVISMLKLMLALIKAYVMLLVQTITAPVQLLFNALPGSQAFSKWLKTTASYLIPFPVAAAMFILAAVFIGDPTGATVFEWTGDANPFGINSSHEFYQGWENNQAWLPPFTLTGSVDFTVDDIMVIIGFFIFTMTPNVVKMAQEWMQVKESPYAAEAIGGFFGVGKAAVSYPFGFVRQAREQHEQKRLSDYAAKRYAQEMNKPRQEQAGKQTE